MSDLAAGSTFERTLEPGETLRIMTGAPMPAGADTVVPQELAERDDGDVRLQAVPAGANVRSRGEDVRAGAVVLRAGCVLRPQELGLIASLGQGEAWVHARPRVAAATTRTPSASLSSSSACSASRANPAVQDSSSGSISACSACIASSVSRSAASPAASTRVSSSGHRPASSPL